MKIYADNASTTFLSDAAFKAYVDALRSANGNASSIHSSGYDAFCAIDDARCRIASLLGCRSEQIIFTSGGSESDSLALISTAKLGIKTGKKHIVTSSIEHHAVLEVLRELERTGFDVTYVDPRKNGIVSADDIRLAVRADTVLVSVMYANNEVGTVQPISDIASVCRSNGIVFHTDAVQAVGHINIDVDAMGIDIMSIAAHKFHGPKGVGALYVRDPSMICPLIRGGMQEFGLRAGTENVPGIVAMAAALEDSLADRNLKNEKIKAMRERLIDGILKINGSHLIGDREMRLDGNASFCFDGVGGEQLVILLDSYGIEASSGSACTARSPEPSHVLTAMGINKDLAASSLRLSIDEYNTESEIDDIINAVTTAVCNIRTFN